MRSTLSKSAIRGAAGRNKPLLRMLWWVSVTRFGENLLVPLVNWMLILSRVVELRSCASSRRIEKASASTPRSPPPHRRGISTLQQSQDTPDLGFHDASAWRRRAAWKACRHREHKGHKASGAQPYWTIADGRVLETRFRGHPALGATEPWLSKTQVREAGTAGIDRQPRTSPPVQGGGLAVRPIPRGSTTRCRFRSPRGRAPEEDKRNKVQTDARMKNPRDTRTSLKISQTRSNHGPCAARSAAVRYPQGNDGGRGSTKPHTDRSCDPKERRTFRNTPGKTTKLRTNRK